MKSLVVQLCQEFPVVRLDAVAPLDLVKQTKELLTREHELSDFLAIRRAKNGLVSVGLGALLDWADEIQLDPHRICPLLDLIIADRCASRIRDSAVLSGANGTLLDAYRRQFAERDRKKIESDRLQVRAKLLQRQPFGGTNVGRKSSWTEMALLSNEFGKQTRFTPVRSILARAGRSVQALMPCFMMSPLSLAKFIPAKALEFDLLVIDEASQMRPEDALGGMLRAKKIVVVGDQKQLPPTDFFSRSTEPGSEEEFEDIDDESILEGCQKAFREVRRLKWHYRSRCESLIRFSNENFYRDCSLITFPAAKPGSFSIDLVRVDGENRARRNVAEAVRVAEEAVKFMRHHASVDEERVPTLGIVAMNTEQRDLIQEELRRLSADDALVDAYKEKVGGKGEEVFVKNLENVQGDERDFIFISFTYGRNPGAPAMLQRFGPINGKQGHRRLNVLFTRARRRIGLFTSFGSEDVKPTDLSAEGVHVLKRYLEYAETRGQATVDEVGAEADSDFEIEVADRLRSRGYSLEMQVGVSGFRIDLGIRHPDHPDRFLVGVECDGASYHSSKSARDRDRLREEVLGNLGWELIRVWSTDWFDNPDRETNKLIKRIEELRVRPHQVDDHYSIFCDVIKTGSDPLDAVHAPTVEGDVGDAEPSECNSVDVVAMSVKSGIISQVTAFPSEGPLTRGEGANALVEFRENVIRKETVDWNGQRSILRDSMIETFISQHLDDSDDWFKKVPTYLRQGTDSAEKRTYLDRICEIVSRIESGVPVRNPSRCCDDAFKLTMPDPPVKAVQGQLPLDVGPRSSKS